MLKLLIQLFGDDDPNKTAQTKEVEDGAGQPQKGEKTPEELAKEKEEKESFNKEQARIRRERERKEELNATRINAIKEAIGNNPYTDKPIETEDDVEEYLLMKKIDKEGGDPKADYSEYLKKFNREKFNREKKEKEDKERMTQELNDFVIAHPDVKLEELLKQDGDFSLFIRGKQGQSLESLYKDYTKIVDKYKNELTAKEREELKALRSTATPGSLGSGTPESGNQFYTEAQIDAMSQREIFANLEKVNKSLEYIRKTKK